MNYKSSISIDRLKLCYTVDTTIAKQISENKTVWNLGEYQVTPTSPQPPHLVSFNIKFPDPSKKNGWFDYCNMSFGNRLDSMEEILKQESEQKQRVWFNFSNRTLYTPLSDGNEISIAKKLYTITDSLYMDLNNITKLELAFDSTRNFATRIKRAIRNDEFVPIVNGTARKNMKEIIKDVIYIHTSDRKRYKTLSVYVRPKGDRTIELKAYNKSEEIKHSTKYYIRQFTGMPENFHRIEIAVQNEAVKEFLKIRKMDVKTFYNGILSDTNFRKDAYLYFSRRLLRFQTPEGVKSILEI